MVMAKTRTGDAIRNLVGEVESEVTRLIAYANDAVVPEVRRGSSRGLRAFAGQLGRLAECLERGPGRRSSAQTGTGR